MAGNAGQHIGNILTNGALLVCARVDKNALKSKTAGLKTVECINEIIVLCRRDALLHHYVTGNCLDIAGNGSCDINRKGSIAYPYFDGAKLWFRADVPVKIFH